LLAVIVILITSFLFGWQQPYFVEKMHVLEYGLLGWLAARDLRRNPRSNIVLTILFSILFVLLIGSLDEGFQRLLPYRVGEIRDVITNVVSGSFGVILFLIK
jgi:VanZ family protein